MPLAYRDRAIARAQGEATRFEALLAEYQKAPAVTRERLYLETMQEIYASNSKVLVDVQNGNNMLYLPLDQLRQRPPTQPAGSTASPNLSQTDMDTLSKLLEEKLRTNPQAGGRSDSGRRREAR